MGDHGRPQAQHSRKFLYKCRTVRRRAKDVNMEEVWDISERRQRVRFCLVLKQSTGVVAASSDYRSRYRPRSRSQGKAGGVRGAQHWGFESVRVNPPFPNVLLSFDRADG